MKLLVIAAVVSVANASAYAGGYALSEQTAVAAGSGGAAVARTGDAGAAWYNPAALTDGAGVRGGVSLIAAYAALFAEGTESMEPWQTGTEGGLRTPASAQLSFAHDDWAIGLSAGVPFGSGVAWPTTWPGRFEIAESRITVMRLAPFVAWRFGRISVSAGLHVDAARMQLARRLDFVDAEGDVALDMDGWGVGGHASVHANVADELDIGIAYKSQTSIDLSGVADFDAPPAFAGRAMDQAVATDITLPDRLTLGSSYGRGRLTVLADLEVTMWGVHDTLTLDFEREQTADIVQTNNWRTAVAIRTGVEFDALPTTKARAGLFFDQSPVPGEHLTPSSPDAHRLGATIGLSHALSPSISIDGFYEALRLLSREATSPEALSARYSGHAHFLGLGLRWQPPR